MYFFLLCVDKKDATFPVVRKERDVCRGNLSRVNTVAALRFAAIQTPQIAPLPRNGFASSAAGGASPVSPCFLIPPQDKFAKQTCPLQKRNTTHWVVFLFWSGLRGSNSLPGIPRIAFRNSQEPCLTSDPIALRAWVSVSSSFRLTKKSGHPNRMS